MNIAKIKCKTPFPTFFISHGGPTLIDGDSHQFNDKQSYELLGKIGKQITDNYLPDYIIMISAHYQASSTNSIEISVNKDFQDKYNIDDNGDDTNVNLPKLHENKLIYDFYGFDEKYYQQKFKSHSSVFVSLMLYDQLKKHGLDAKIVDRGIDHGVWCPSKVMFGETLNIPLIQVSLPYSENFNDSYQLGKVLKFFRDNLIWDTDAETDLKGMIICSGSSVHNLRDFGRYLNNYQQPVGYVDEFHDLIRSTFQKSTPLTILQNLNNFTKDSNFRQLLYHAHPTLEHFLPLVVAAGTDDGNNEFKELCCNGISSLGYGMYQFGGKDDVHLL